jgi:ABC-type nickel/cobalt efflux system permease component RcnA
MRRLTVALVLAATAVLVLAAPVFAHDGGEGWYGPANDKVITNAGFILIAFFPLFVFAVSLIQWRLDKRKAKRKKAAKAQAASPEWRGGW